MSTPHTARDAERFWDKVDRRSALECWNWKASKFTGGYGRFRIGKHYYLANRVSLEMDLGRKLVGGECALHDCDNPSCVNPFHLFIGTIADNNRDMFQKGRRHAAVGERHGRHKLSNAIVINIRQRIASGAFGIRSQIAREFGLATSVVSDIANRNTWKHLI